MSLSLGSTTIGSLYLGSTKVGSAYLGNVKVYESAIVLPAYTIRLKFTDGVTPTFSKGTAVQVSASPNVWDLTYENTSWTSLLYGQTQLLSVLGANTSGVLDMATMFFSCSNLTSVHLFDTSSVTTTASMFRNCTNLTSVPLFNTGNVTTMGYMFDSCSELKTVPLLQTDACTNMDRMFYGCRKVESGALALYQQASTQTTPPSSHSKTFTNCGVYTESGATELTQIPADWGGTMSA